MEPFYTGANHNIARTLELFEDLGWAIAPADSTDGDFDGDGKSDIAVYRDGNWFILSLLGWRGDLRRAGEGCRRIFQCRKTMMATERADVLSSVPGWYMVYSSVLGMVEVTAIGWGGLLEDIPVPEDYDGDGRADVAVYRVGTWYIIHYRMVG